MLCYFKEVGFGLCVRLLLCFRAQYDGAPVSSCRVSAEFQAKSKDKDGNSLALQFLSGEKVTVVASKTSRESDCHLYLLCNTSTTVNWENLENLENQEAYDLS